MFETKINSPNTLDLTKTFSYFLNASGSLEYIEALMLWAHSIFWETVPWSRRVLMVFNVELIVSLLAVTSITGVTSKAALSIIVIALRSSYCNEMKYKQILLCRNNSKIKYQNRRKRQNRYPWHKNTRPLIFLAWYRHFNKMCHERLWVWFDNIIKCIWHVSGITLISYTQGQMFAALKGNNSCKMCHFRSWKCTNGLLES